MSTTEKKTAAVKNSALLEAVQVLKRLRTTTTAEIRANLRLYDELGLSPIEEFVDSNAPEGTFENQDAYLKAVVALNDRIKAMYPVDSTTEISFSKAVADTFRSYMDQMTAMFPAGKTEAGVDVPAGLPHDSMRRLAPLLIAVDEAWPV